MSVVPAFTIEWVVLSRHPTSPRVTFVSDCVPSAAVERTTASSRK